MKSKLGVISAAHNDLTNLTASSEIGTLFLDLDLRIRMFTPPVAELINIANGDVGRPITNFTHRLDYGDVTADVRRVLHDLEPSETEVRTIDDRWFTVRIRPYRTMDGKVEGAVVTFDDVTARVRAEQAQRRSVQRFQALAATAGDTVYHMSADWRLMYQLDSDTLAQTPEPIEDWVGKYIPEEDRPAVRAAIADAIRTKSMFELEHRIRQADGAIGWVLSRAMPLLDGAGEIAEWFGTGSDVTDRKRAEGALRESEERQGFILKLADALRPLDAPGEIIKAATDLLRGQLSANRGAYYEIEGDDYVIRVDSAEGVPSMVGRYPLAKFGDALLERHLNGRSPIVVEDVTTAHSAAEHEGFAAIQVGAYIGVMLVKQDQFVAGLTVQSRDPRVWSANDVAMVQETAERIWAAVERARVEEALRASEERFRTLFGNMGQAYIDVELIRDASGRAIDYRYLDLNPAYERLTGVPADQAVGRASRDVIPDLSSFWVRTFEQTVAACTPQRFDYEEKALGRWFQVFTYPGIGDRLTVLAEDITEQKRAEAAVKSSEQQQRLIIELVPALLWQADPAGHEIIINEQWLVYTGQRADEVRDFGWLDAIHPDDLPATRAAFEHAFATGEPIERQQRIRKDGEGYRWHLVRHVPVRDADGEIARWFGAAIEVDELHRLQDRQEVMVKELQHRTRNLITVVRSLSSQTLKNSVSLDDFDQRFGQRLAALSRVQRLLSNLSAGKRVTFDDLLDSELAALGAPEDKLTLDGPSGVPLRSATVQIFSLVLHELATNALKYGALTKPSGHLTVRWSVERAAAAEPWLHVDWRERWVASTKADDVPRGGGYGRELIEHALPYQLGARTTFEIRPSGVHCTIAVPVSAAQDGTDQGLEQHVS